MILLLSVFLAACSQQIPQPEPLIVVNSPTHEKQADDLYRPPTAAPETPLAPPLPSETATTSPPTATPRPSATQVCIDELTFLEDLTIPDGSIILPGLPVDKRWKVENSGNCNWDEGYRLRLIRGPNLDAAIEQALYPARSGTQVEIRISFTSPSEPGRYRSAWQAHNPSGEPFGQIIYLEIIVE